MQIKMSLVYKIVFLLCVLAGPMAAGTLCAQDQPSPTDVRRELDRRNIPEEIFRARLEREGIDLENSTPAELAENQGRIEAILNELEAERAAASTPASNSTAAPAGSANSSDKAPRGEGAPTDQPAASADQEPPPPPPVQGGTSKIYGHNIFRNKSVQLYRTTDNPTPPNSYPLKTGDQIAVNIFGASQTDFILIIDENGFVTLPVGTGFRVPVAGLPIGEARSLLARRLSRFYTFRDGQLNLRIQAARTISVNIFGEVFNNGSFSISSLNTGFNALVAAGGPTDAGTVRNIQLIEGDQTTVLDVYEYLRNPTASSGLFLNNNATIFVPLAANLVTLEGGVERPMIYELRDGETITDLLDYAGGALPRAETADIRVTRFVDGQLELFNVDLATQPDFELLDEDVVNLPVIEDPIENFVRIEGAVLLPGRYAITPDMTIGDLVRKGRLRPGARRDVAFLFRQNDDGTTGLEKIDLANQLGGAAGASEVLIQRGDRLRILTSEAFVDRADFSVRGAVRGGELTLPYPERGVITLEEAVLLAGGSLPNASREVTVVRTPAGNSEQREYLRLDLVNDATFTLDPRDEVTVYAQESFTDRRQVNVGGAVRRSGEYVYDPRATLADYLFLAGGLTLNADSSRIDIYRLELNDGEETRTLLRTTSVGAAATEKLAPFDEVVVRPRAGFELIETVEILGEVRYPGTYALFNENERLSDLIARAGGLTDVAFPTGATLLRPTGNEGRIVLDLDEVLFNTGAASNMVLRVGDVLNIPARNDLVTIFIDNTLAARYGRDSIIQGDKIKVAYQGPRSAKWYIDNFAGGFDDEAARKRWTTVQSASGGLTETRSFLGLKDYPTVYPGGKIRVAAAPPKKQRERREERFDWIGLVSVLTGAATTIITFFLLRRRNNE